MKKYIFIILIFIGNILYSQDKTISNYALIKGIETNNKLYSGLVNISVPLYQINLGNGMLLGNDLTYESNGFRPHIEPDMVGLNWNVNLIGKITRETNRPLTRQYSLYYSTVNGNEQDCFKPNTSSFTKKTLIENPTSTSDDYFKWMVDKYYFDFLGYKGYFVVDHNGKAIVYCESANITVDINNLGCQPLFGEITYSEITLKDDKGNTFIFGGSSNELEINYHQLNVDYYERFTDKTSISTVYNAHRNIRTNYIVSWSLKKAILNNGRIINAYYKNSNKSILNSFINEGKNVKDPFTISFPSKQTLQNNSLFIGRINTSGFTSSTREGQEGTTESSQSNDNSVYSKLSVLDSVSISDIGKIMFEYENTTNPLELTKVYLKGIKVLDINNKKTKDLSLSYENLGGLNKRTFLKKVSNEKNEEYLFDYYKNDILPSYDPSPRLRNEMGFWNGKLQWGDADNTDLEIFKTGLLKRVLLPTRGYKEFFYEANKYSMIYKDTNNVENVAEDKYYGARVYKEVNNDGSNTYTKTYKYTDQSNKSTGILDKGIFLKVMPVTLMNDYGQITFAGARTVSSENLSPNMYSLDLIHYEQVQEIDGRGIKKYFFTSRKTNPDSLAASYFKNSNFHGVSNLGYSKPLSKENERGKLLKVEILDKNGSIKSTTEYKYTNFLNNAVPLKEPTNSCINCKISDNNYYVFTEGLASADGRRMYVPVLPYLPTSITTTEYLGSQTIANSIKKSYNNNYLYWHPFPIEEISTPSDGSEINIKTYYPGDLIRLNSNCITNNCNDTDVVGGKFTTYKNMLGDNIISPIISIEKNSRGKSRLLENIYSKDVSTSNIWKVIKTRNSLLNADFSSLGNVQTEDKDYFQLYDNKGNLIQASGKDGVPITTIWGYHQTLPIVQIIGITYAQLMQIFSLSVSSNSYLNLDIVKKSDLDKDASSEQTLISSLELFRKNSSLKDYPITTYTYNPLVGLTTKTFSSGIRENYVYDDLNRLGKITNMNGEIIKEFNYNYAPPFTYPTIFYNSEKSKVFKRTNCGENYAGGKYEYVVPAETYSSYVKDDAEQQAINDLNTNGQKAANQNAICIPSTCPFNPMGGLKSVSAIYTDEKKIVHFEASIRNYSISPGYWNTARTIGIITGDCRPTTPREFTFDEPPGGAFGTTPANRTWQIRIDGPGNVSAKLLSGSVGTNSGAPWNFTFEFNKNE